MNNENQRIRLSKKMLKQALIGLLGEKSIEKVTIYEVCARAEINRTTFYKYYGSQYDLLDDIEADAFMFIENELSGNMSNPISQVTTILNYIRDNAKTMLVLTEATTDKDFAYKLLSRPLIRETICCRTPAGLPEGMKDYISTFYFNGWYAIIRRWLANGTPETSEEIANFLFSLSSSLYGEPFTKG